MHTPVEEMPQSATENTNGSNSDEQIQASTENTNASDSDEQGQGKGKGKGKENQQPFSKKDNGSDSDEQIPEFDDYYYQQQLDRDIERAIMNSLSDQDAGPSEPTHPRAYEDEGSSESTESIIARLNVDKKKSANVLDELNTNPSSLINNYRYKNPNDKYKSDESITAQIRNEEQADLNLTNRALIEQEQEMYRNRVSDTELDSPEP